MLKLSSDISPLYFALGREKSFEVMAEIGYDGVDYSIPHAKLQPSHELFRAVNNYVFEKILPTAEEYNVLVALENMPGVPFKPDELNPVTSRPETLIEYIEMMDSPYLGACLDTGHANCAGIPAGAFARMLGKRLKALHLHDNFAKIDAHSLLYTGSINWKDLAAALKEIGYSGSLSLEWRVGGFPKEYMVNAEKFAFETLKKFATDNGL